MKNVVNQRLCGGTFFTLLLQARKPRMGVREHYMSTTDGLSEPETLIALAKVVVPDMLDPQESMMKTIKSNVFNFKTCTKSVYYKTKYEQIAKRRGKKRAIIAIATPISCPRLFEKFGWL